MTLEELSQQIERQRAEFSVEINSFKADINVLRQDASNLAPHPIKVAFDTHYMLYNATTAFSLSLTTLPPRGSISMIDAGTTPNRCIALYLSAGDKMVEIFAKVI